MLSHVDLPPLHLQYNVTRVFFFFVLDAVVKTGEYNNVKYLLPQAAYTVGGHSFNAATMEFSLLKSKSTSHRSQLVRTQLAFCFPTFPLIKASAEVKNF